MVRSTDSQRRWEIVAEALIVAAAAVLAAFLARPYAGSWNDGSRLASVESLIDRHTWIIDDSIFVRVPAADAPDTPLPYSTPDRTLLDLGTQDKLFINGHYYSDKSPVPAVLLASCYQLWQWTTGMTARSHPDLFCRTMTLASSGLAYVVAVWCMYRVGRRLSLPFLSRLLLTASFALATVALPYSRQVNNHILLLAVTSTLALGVAGLRDEIRIGRASELRFVTMGFLAGLGYTIDLGVGPVILLCSAGLVASDSFNHESEASDRARTRFRLAPKRTVIFMLAALPWLILHHALNYVIGGSFEPANANLEYFRWPGSPFAAGNLTGSWIHPSFGSFMLYAASMLAGKRGFFGHNLPLFLAMPALLILLRPRGGARREVLWALGCCAGTWLLYAATSNNSSGQSCTIRWFVPLLAPAYFILALLLHHQPRYRVDLLILSSWGVLLVVLMREGPWKGGMVPFFWPIQAASLATWGLLHYLRRRALVATTQHSYTNALGISLPQEERPWLWITTRSSSGGHASTISATLTSTCPVTNSSSSPV